MRTLTIFTLLVLLYLSSIAQEGNYYRFKVKVQLKDNSELTGYIYTDSLQDYFYYSKKHNFSEFVKKEIGYPLNFCKEIIELDHSRTNNLHFSVDSKLLKLDQTDLLEIILLKKDLYSKKPRLVIMNESEYKLLQKELKSSITINNSNDTGKCFVTFLFFVDELDLFELIDNILPIFEKLDNDIPFEERTEFIEQEKEKLIDKGIILFELCD
ncbi:MAG TPA: hypothetical protein VK982_10595 [Bacteroidales bacterium]|nr:hypothetical protein [Bacteroidales bacterium]